MNRDEVIDLLTAVSASDRRTVGQSDVEVWQTTIGDLGLAECQRALVAHIRECPGVWLEPGHILRRVEADRERLLTEAAEQRQAIAWQSLGQAPKGAYLDHETGMVAKEYDPVTGQERVKVPASSEHRKKCMEQIRAVLANPATRFGSMPV